MRIRLAVLSLLALLPLAAPGQAQDGRRGGRAPATRWDRMKRFDANGDGKVTREEFTGPARIFRQLDRDGNGEVTEEEATRAARRSGAGTEAAGNGWVFRRLDRDGSGGFDAKDLERILGEADGNGDGTLSEEEFLEFLQAKASAPRRGEAPAPGDVAPDFRLPAAEGGAMVALSDLVKKGRPVVLVFGSFT